MKTRNGFTLIELMIIVGILSLLMVALLSMLSKQKPKAEDARVKNDLKTLQIAFEDYYGDNNCYPPPEWFDDAADCGADYLSPYLTSMPCNKKTNMPYKIEYAPSQCVGYRLYATLQDEQDPEVQALSDPNGSTLGNYGVSSANTTIKVKVAGPRNYYCSSIGNCTLIPAGQTCTPSYESSSCDYTGSGNYCQSLSSCH